MSQPRFRVTPVTINAAHPRTLADFYARLLGWTVADEDPPRHDGGPETAWAQVRPPEGEVGPRLNFEYDEEYESPAWPSVGGEQHSMEHLDIWVDDLQTAVAWALEAGATLAHHQPQSDVRVLIDPAGHPFCLFTSTRGRPAGRSTSQLQPLLNWQRDVLKSDEVAVRLATESAHSQRLAQTSKQGETSTCICSYSSQLRADNLHYVIPGRRIRPYPRHDRLMRAKAGCDPWKPHTSHPERRNRHD
jgi:catechol 2,3-dioxygenase-like lactoylglutathione lyase family enzyme